MRTNAMRAIVAALTVAALTSCAAVRQGIAELGLTCNDARQVVDQVCTTTGAKP